MFPRQDRHRTLWWAALAASTIPLLLGLLLSVLSSGGATVGVSFGFAGAVKCRGWWLQLELWPLQWLAGMPFLVVGPAFALWARTRSRVPGWTAVTILLLAGLAKPLLAAYDMATWGEGCAAMWEPFVPQTLGWDLYLLVPAGLIYLTVRRRRALGRRGRVATGTALAVVLLLTIGGDHRRHEIVAAAPEECRTGHIRLPRPEDLARVEAIARMPVRDREHAYLCMMRGHDYFPEKPQLEDVDDGELLWRGRRMCTRMDPQGRPTRAAVDEWRHLGGGARFEDALAYLCPDVALRQARAAAERSRRLEREYQKEHARDEASCRRSIRRAPRAVRQKTALLTTGEGGGYYISDGSSPNDPFSQAIDDGLIASSGSTAAVMTGVENDDICITVRAYRKAPPLDLKGWDRVQEVGIDSPHGTTRLYMPMDAPPKLPALTAAGPGPYRVRVHVRNRDAADLLNGPLETHLVQVFPGTSKRPVLHKNTEHRN
ncbi:hypothetical protein [Actinomadura miaoliensis]|uniref:Uncharacterized protein n=1 Tax=Actinomadura miaoliensis TaxID=430685 RepID=A0ABP7WSC1_9ACTN